MSFDDFYKRLTAFGLAFTLGLFAAAFLHEIGFSGIFEKEFEPAAKIAASKVNSIENSFGGNGNGASGGCLGPDDSRNFPDNTSEKSDAKPVGPTEGVKIISKPPAFTNIEGRFNEERLKLLSGKKVVLRVTFGANGQIGAISVISGLPEGLTEEAIEAAKKIKFKPARRGGVPYSVTKPVEYELWIY
jgi:TonB family protein